MCYNLITLILLYHNYSHMNYFFILGNNPILSKAEIESVLQISDLRSQISDFNDRVLIVEVEKKLDINWLNNRLGGTVKMGLISDKIKDLEKFEDKFFDLIKFSQGKMHFGFSLYALTEKVHLKKYQKELKPVAMEIKRKLREEKNLNSRWVVGRDPELSSVIVKKNQLLKYGSEICLFVKRNNILVGQTLAVQKFEEYGAFDYLRPKRDVFSGMLPPKVAQIMINLAKVSQEKTILDPFCGSGTIIQMALFLDYKNLIGCDKSQKAIADTKENLKWQKNKFKIDLDKINLYNLPAERLTKEIKANSIGAIITEPYLGPPLRGNENQEKISSIIKELEELYLQAFEQFKTVLAKKGKAVIVFPIFKLNNFTKKMLILDKIKNLGFRILNNEELIYSRPKQHILRQIIIFEKI